MNKHLKEVVGLIKFGFVLYACIWIAGFLWYYAPVTLIIFVPLGFYLLTVASKW